MPSRNSVLKLAAALLLLNGMAAFLNWWPTPAIRWTGGISIELVLLIVALAVWRQSGRAMTRTATGALAIAWLLLAFGRYVQVTAPALWGRELNLYWDLQFIPDVAAMLARAAHPLLVLLFFVVSVLLLALAWRGVRWALGTVDRALDARALRLGLGAAGLVLVAAFAVNRRAATQEPSLFAEPVLAEVGRQVKFVYDARFGTRALPPSPAFDENLGLLDGEDVLLVFAESYGAVVFERPEFSSQLSTRRAMLDAEISNGNRRVASAFVESTTFGGSSWFAHITLLSGVPIRDPQANALLMTESRVTWPAAMKRHGYRTVALMPGLWYPWPEGAFYGFDDIYNGQRLDYKGPPFGWWATPDQFTLAKFDELELSRSGRKPLFLFFPTVSTHTPFAPVPPYQPDWPRMLTSHPFDDEVLEKAYDETVDWTNLGPSYAQAVDYAYQMLTGYLARHRDDNFVMIVIGDHQPPALVSGEGAPWDVPVHVITRRPELLETLKARGFRDGLTPARPSIGSMETLLPLLLQSFSASAGESAQAGQPSQ